MIDITPLDRDGDKALLRAPLKNKESLIWKLILTETWPSHQAHVPLKPSQQDANVISYPVLQIFFLYKEFPSYVK